MLATFVELFTMPLAGWLSDRVGRKAIYIGGTLFSIVFAFPLFWLLDTRDPTVVLLTLVVGMSCTQSIIFALHASFMPELFGTKVRYSGISLGYQVGAAIGGGGGRNRRLERRRDWAGFAPKEVFLQMVFVVRIATIFIAVSAAWSQTAELSSSVADSSHAAIPRSVSDQGAGKSSIAQHRFAGQNAGQFLRL